MALKTMRCVKLADYLTRRWVFSLKAPCAVKDFGSFPAIEMMLHFERAGRSRRADAIMSILLARSCSWTFLARSVSRAFERTD